MAVADQEWRPDPLFEPLDLPADGGLAQVQSLGSPGHPAVIEDGEQHAERFDVEVHEVTPESVIGGAMVPPLAMTHWNEINADMSLVNGRRPFDTRHMASNMTSRTVTETPRWTGRSAATELDDCGLASGGCVQCELERASGTPAAPDQPRRSPRRISSILRRIKHHGGSTDSLSRRALERLDPVVRDARG